MQKRKTQTSMICFCSLAFLFLSNCTADEWPGTETKITFRLTSPNAMDGKITIDEAYLKLSSIEIKGSVPNGNGTNIVHTIPPADPPFRLTNADSGAANVSIPAGAYTELVFDLVLFPDTYDLVMNDPPVQETPAPAGNDDTGTGSEPASDSGQGNEDPNNNNNNNNNNGAGANNGGDDDAPDANGDGETPSDDHDDGNDDTGSEGQHNDDQKGDKGKKDKDKDKHKKGDNRKDDNKGHHGKDDSRVTDSETTPALDLDNFFRNAKPGILVIGTYENNGRSMRLIFVGTGLERLSVAARQNDSPQVILAGNGSAEMTFNPERWFSSITPDDLEAATVLQYQGEPVLFIHPGFNSNLFQALMPHVQESADLNFAGAGF